MRGGGAWQGSGLSDTCIRSQVVDYFFRTFTPCLWWNQDDILTPCFSFFQEEDSSHEPTAAKVLSGIFETFDKIMTKIDRYRSPNQESTFDLNSKLDKIIEIEYKLLSP